MATAIWHATLQYSSTAALLMLFCAYRCIALLLVLHLCFPKQIPDVLFCLANILAEHLRAVHNLRLLAVQHLANLPRNEGLASSWRPVQ